jgi:chromosome segregation protein
MKIETGFETAVAAALGSLADALVADSREAGIAALDHLKNIDGGRAEIIVADVESEGKLKSLPKVVGARAAADVVKAPSGVLALLENVVIVDDLVAAQRLYQNDKSVINLVLITLDGDVLTNSVLRGGSSSKPSKVELVAERDAADKKLARVTEQLETYKAELAQAKSNETAAKESAAAAHAALNAHDSELAANAEKLGRLRVQVEASQADLDRLIKVAEQAEASIELALNAVALAERNKAEFESQERPQVNVDDRDRLAQELENRRQVELEIRVELGAALERARVETQRVAQLKAQIADAQLAIERAKAAAEKQANQLARASRVASVLPVLLAKIAESATFAKVKLHELETQRSNQNAELVRLRGETAEIQMKLQILTQSVHDIEMANHEKRLNLANLASRANDELGLEQEILLAEYGPQNRIPDETAEDGLRDFNRDEQLRRLRDGERLYEKLGKVNPLALEEFAALEERHKFLTEQLADLTQTRKDLLQIIEDLDVKMQAIFAEAFEDTKNAFERVFPVLFPGGSGSIFLTNPEDLLTTGIEVSVKPAGKRIERLSLLSGGERSLAAVALLIAIFKARPSPFYVMDEVEAALDDANLGRLLQILEDLKTNSQLIIITHQKRTMEIADALYGVSMRQDGVSAVVGQRLIEKA